MTTMPVARIISNVRSRLLALGVLVLWSYLAADVRGDSGTLRDTVSTETLEISIFTSPTPVRTGTLDVNLLVRPIPADARRALPACQICFYPEGQQAKKKCEASTLVPLNSPFRAAQLELPEQGVWHVEVTIDADRILVSEFSVTAEEGVGGEMSYVAWIGLPVAGIWLFIMHRRLVKRNQRIAAKHASQVQQFEAQQPSSANPQGGS
jgi:hypothetical protein